MRCVSTRSKCLISLAVPFLLGLPSALVAQEGDSRPVRELFNARLSEVAARDGATQYMMIDVLDIDLPGSDGGPGQRTSEDGPVPADGDLYLSVDEAGNARVFSGPTANELTASPPTVQEVGFRGFLRSLGESTGRAFQLQMESDGPVRFNGEGIVVEPLVIRDQARIALEQEITQLAARSPVTTVLNAYCLEFAKQPPSVNQVFRIAEEQMQTRFAAAANILKAGRKLVKDGVFKDHPIDYIHSVKQWALWVHEGRFSFEQFSERFLAHAEDNFAAAGLPWTDPVAAAVGMSLPGRWGHVHQVLTEAGVEPGGSEGSE